MVSEKRIPWAVWAVLVAVIMGIPGWVMVGLWFWSRWYPDPTKGPNIMRQLMTGWLPISMITASSVLSAIVLLIGLIKLWKNKRLAEDLKALAAETERLKAELLAESEKVKSAEAALAAHPAACSEPRLHVIGNTDKNEIQSAVTVRGILFRNQIEQGKRYVDFVFSIFNQSLYDIAIDGTLGDGQISFDGEPLVKEKAVVENKAQLVPPRMPGSFTVRQYLDFGDVDAIKKATDDRIFRLDALWIKVKGGPEFVEAIDEKRLKIDYSSLSKGFPQWVNFDGPFQSRFNGEISGKVMALYFQSQLNLDLTHVISDDMYYDLLFVMYVYIANHGAPTSIERFKLGVTANGVSFEGERQSLTGFRVVGQGLNDPLVDIEDSNYVNLDHSRKGWLRFAVRGVKRYEEDKPELTLELDVIDKEETPNRLAALDVSKWRGHSRTQDTYIIGTDEDWQL